MSPSKLRRENIPFSRSINVQVFFFSNQYVLAFVLTLFKFNIEVIQSILWLGKTFLK